MNFSGRNRNRQATNVFLKGAIPIQKSSPFSSSANADSQLEQKNACKVETGLAAMLGVSTKGEKTNGDMSRCERYCKKMGMRRPSCPICGGRKVGDK
jgi:hypothetical protein